MSLIFRLAQQQDAPALSQFGADTFTDWYLPDNDPDNVHQHVRDTYSPELQAAEIAEDGQWAVLAEHDGNLAGYGLLRTNRACPDYPATDMAEIRRFYVGRRWHGQGIAPALMAAVIEQGRQTGAQGFWLTCWERNPRALAFYAKCGFKKIGTTTFTVGLDPQTDHLLVRMI